MVKFVESKLRVAPPLHKLCISNDPLDDRLPAIRQALASGEDPNELGGWKHAGVSRPLHYAISDHIGHDFAQLKQNLPVVELLLEAGADPRLPGLGPYKSPMEELENWLIAYNDGDHSGWQTEELELQPFFEAALQAMKKVALVLDGKHKTHALELETLTYNRNSERHYPCRTTVRPGCAGFF